MEMIAGRFVFILAPPSKFHNHPAISGSLEMARILNNIRVGMR